MLLKIKSRFALPLGSTLASLILLHFTAGLGVLNPREDDWLSAADGTYEIAWEFYRHTPFPDWLIGEVPLYGLDMARPSFYVLPTFYSLPLRTISFVLGERFQFIGLLVLLNLFLHFYFGAKIFLQLKFSQDAALVSSVVLLFSPVLLARYIEHTHYTLTSHWIILATFYFFIKRESSLLKWFLLTLASILIFPYYFVSFILIFILFFIISFYLKSFSRKKLFLITSTVLSGSILSGVLSGFFFFSQEIQADQRVFSANLNSFFNPRGWSQLLESRSEHPDSYEGFAFIGLHFVILVTLLLILLLFKHNRKKIYIGKYQSFFLILIPSLILLLISLAQDMYFDEHLLFSLPANPISSNVSTYFRSPGRFIWMFVYFFMILVLVLIYQIVKIEVFNLLVVVSLLVSIIDMQPALTMSKSNRFQAKYESPLKSSFWSELHECYENIYFVPPVTSGHLLYPIARVAFRQKMGIFPAAIPRVPPAEQDARQLQVKREFKLGNLYSNSIYIFQDADFVPLEITEQNFTTAINTMDSFSRAGVIDNIKIIAPNVENCPKFFNKYELALNVKRQNLYLIKGAALDFDDPKINRYLISGWSDVEPWGVWTNDFWSEILIQSEKKPRFIDLVGHRFKKSSGLYPPMSVYLNGELVHTFDEKLVIDEKIRIPLSESTTKASSYLIEFRFENLTSPMSEGIAEDERMLGFALKSLYLVE